jgi:hypothetical protein
MLQCGDLDRLGSELDLANTPHGSLPEAPSAEAERRELLEGIVDEIRNSLAHSGGHWRTSPYGVDVWVQLLEHLAGTAAGARCPNSG